MMKKHHKILSFVIGISIFAFLLWKLNIRQSWEKIVNLDVRWFLLAVGLMALTQLLGFLKWKVMCDSTTEKEQAPPLLAIFSSVLVSGMLTPARSGDVFASLAWKSVRGKVLAWSVFHRISEGLTTIFLALFILGVFFREQLSGMAWLVSSSIVAFIMLAVFLILNRRFGHFLFRCLRGLLKPAEHFKIVQKILSVEAKIEEQIEIFYDTLSQFRKKHTLWRLAALTLGNRAVIIFVNMAILASLGVFLAWNDILGILAATWVGAFFAPTPGGLGIGDIAPSLVLSGLGFQDYAGGYIVLNRLFEISIIVLWMMVWMASVRSLKKEPSHEMD